MAETLNISDFALQQPFKVYRADSGGITFQKVAKPQHWNWKIGLFAKECPHQLIFTIIINYHTSRLTVMDELVQSELFEKNLSEALSRDIMSQKYWISWYNGSLQLGIIEESCRVEPFFQFTCSDIAKSLIGFVKFTSDHYIDFVVDAPPINLNPISLKHIEGQLRWVKVTDGKLPDDAMIGGFENEPVYVARAVHGRSLCPGKYKQSSNRAYVAWGQMEHTKTIFEILCGFNGYWVKCKDDLIPENVFHAGNSEVNGEDIYIGRAMIGGDLVCGKVHMLYKTCYLPYKGKEVEKTTYEILVRGDKPMYGTTKHKNCLLNPLKAFQPCI